MNGNDFRIILARLRSGEVVIGRRNPEGGIMNPFFVIVEFVEQPLAEDGTQQPPKKKVSIRPFIEMFDGLTKLEDNYFISLKKDDISFPLEPTDNLILLYGKCSKQMVEPEKTEPNKKENVEKAVENVISFNKKE